MNKGYKCMLVILFILILLPITGCWDSRELNTLSIVMGIGLDDGDQPGKFDISLQVAKNVWNNKGPNRDNSGSGNGEAFLLLQESSENIYEGLFQISKKSNRSLILRHNQLFMSNVEISEQGLLPELDIIMRNQKIRIGTSMVVAEGRSADILGANVEQETMSAIFIDRMLRQAARIAPSYRMRALDFISDIIGPSKASMLPLIKLHQNGDKNEIKIEGCAVFKEDKMVGRLNYDEMVGYIWYNGRVKQDILIARSPKGRVVINIDKLVTSNENLLQPDGSVQPTCHVEAELDVVEIIGFKGMTLKEAAPYWSIAAKEAISEKITASFKAAQYLKADIYGIGSSLYSRHPKEWELMEDNWDEIFASLSLDVKVDVNVQTIGKVVRSLEMEED